MRRSAPSSSHGTSYTLPKGSPALTFLARFPNDQRNAALDCVALYGLHALLSTYSLIELTVSLGALEAITETACRGAGKLLHKVHVPRAGQGDSTNVVFGVKPPKRLARQAAATAAAAARAATLATSAATAPMTSTAQQRSGEASTKATGRNRGTHATQPSDNSSSNGGGGGIHATSRGVNGGGAPNSGTVQSRYAENAERAAAAAAAAALAATTAAAQAAGNATQSRHDVCSAWPFVDEEGTVTDALQGGSSEWMPGPKKPPGGGAANSGGFGGQRSGGHMPGRGPPPHVAARVSSSQRRAAAAESAADSGGSGLWNWAGGGNGIEGSGGGGGGEGLRGSVFETAPLREQLRRVAKVFDEYCNHKQRVSRFELVDMLGDLGLSACFDELVLVLPPSLVPLPRGPFGLDTDHATHAAIAWLTEHQFRRCVNELLVARNCPELPMPGDDLTRGFSPLVAGGNAPPFAHASLSPQAQAERAAYEAVLEGKCREEFEEKIEYNASDDGHSDADVQHNDSDSYFDKDVPLSSLFPHQKQSQESQQQHQQRSSNMIPPRGRAARDAAAASATRMVAREAVESYAATSTLDEDLKNDAEREDEEGGEKDYEEKNRDYGGLAMRAGAVAATGGKMFETWVPLDDGSDNDEIDHGYGNSSRPPIVGGSGQGGRGTRVATGKASGRGALKPSASSGSALVGGSGTYGVEPWSVKGFVKKKKQHHNNSSSSNSRGQKGGSGRPPWREDVPEGQPGADPWQQSLQQQQQQQLQGGFGPSGFGTRFNGNGSCASGHRQQRALPAYLQGVGSKLKDAIGQDKEVLEDLRQEFHQRNRAAGQDALAHTLVEQHAQHPDKGYLRGGPHTKTAPLGAASSSSSRSSGKPNSKKQSQPPSSSSSGGEMLQGDAHWEAIADAMLSSDLLNHHAGAGGADDDGPPVEVYVPPPPPPPLPKHSTTSSSTRPCSTAKGKGNHRRHGNQGEASRPHRDYSGWVGDFGNVRDFDFDSQPAYTEETYNASASANVRDDSYGDVNYGKLSSELHGNDHGQGGGTSNDDDKRWKMSSSNEFTINDDKQEGEGDSASGLFPRRTDDSALQNKHVPSTEVAGTSAEDDPSSLKAATATAAPAAAESVSESSANNSTSMSGVAPPGGGMSDGSLVAPWVSPLPPTGGEGGAVATASLADGAAAMSPSSFDGSATAAAAHGE